MARSPLLSASRRTSGAMPCAENTTTAPAGTSSTSDTKTAPRRASVLQTWVLGTCPGAMWYPVLEGECDMRVPQVSERIKEAPAQALRGVFAGIGQLLLITDKLRNKASHQDVPRARTPEASETVTDGAVTSPA